MRGFLREPVEGAEEGGSLVVVHPPPQRFAPLFLGAPADLIEPRGVQAAVRIDYKRYQRLEAGGVNTTMRTLLRVAEALGADVWGMIGKE